MTKTIAQLAKRKLKFYSVLTRMPILLSLVFQKQQSGLISTTEAKLI